MVKKTNTLANKADKHVLYEQCVQNAEFEINWIEEQFLNARARPLRHLKEDFCGTANASCEFVRHHPDNRVTGMDLDADVLGWGGKHHVAQLTQDEQSRITLVNDNVLNPTGQTFDAVLAMNFSYWVFKTRPQLLTYFKTAYGQLNDDGMLFLDAFGGYEAFNDEQEEVTEHEGFDYVWHLKEFNPVNFDANYAIHFTFPDGSAIENAFEYHWRHWNLPEIKELLEEAGFHDVTFFFQDWDYEADEAKDVFVPRTESDADPGWVAYISAKK